MGMIPIILFLLGFILLWSILTYSSLTEKFKAGLTLKNEARELFHIRQHLYYKARNIEAGPSPDMDSLSLADHKQVVKDIESYVASRRLEGTVSSDVEEMERVNHAFASTYSTYLKQSKGYNGLINEKPTSYLAKVFSLQPLV
jgi:hypothetical protein